MSKEFRRCLGVIFGALTATILLVAANAAAQATTASTTHLSGTVVDAATASPIRRARVVVGATTRMSSAVFTDERGAFELDTSSDVTLTITKAGYALETVKAPARGAGSPTTLRVFLKRGAAITGHVVDSTGVPAVNATVAARRVSDAETAAPLTVTTDDVGEFRFGGLAEGEFRVAALAAAPEGRSPRATDGNTETLARAIAAASPVRVRPGDTIDAGELTTVGGNIAVAGGTAVSGGAGTAIVSGSVKDGRGRPVKAVVRLLRVGAALRYASTDAQGRFRFENLDAGAYVAEATRPGVPAVKYGQRSAGQPGTPVEVRDNAVVNNIDFVLTSGTAVAGTITDEYGEPVQGANVRALQIRRAGDRLAALTVPGAAVQKSDDRGAYRIFGLLPGRYLVVATESSIDFAEPSTKGAYPPTFYPGATSVTDAIPVRLDDGDAAGVDVAFRPQRTVRVTGTAFDSEGRAVAGVLLVLSQRSGAILLEPALARVAPDGTFVFENVPPGDYVVQGIAPAGGPPKIQPDKPVRVGDMEFGRQYVTIVDAEPAPVELRTSAGATLHGRIRVDGDVAALSRSLTVWPFPTDFDASFAIGSGPAGLKTKDDGAFDVTGVTGPRRFTLMGPVAGWYLKDARVNGADALDTPFDFGLTAREFDVEIVVSPAAAALSGTATRPGGVSVADYAVLVFSTDSNKWYLRSQSLRMEHASQDGAFRVSGLPPGAYYAIALSDNNEVVTSDDWADPTTLERLRPLATRITLGESDARTTTLRLVSP